MPDGTRAPASRIEWLSEVDSTNAEAMRRSAQGERGPVWIAAERQTAGRGRSGRAWDQAHGNLAASLLFPPEAPVQVLHQLSLLAGVAVHDAVTEVGGLPLPALRLKWPNDILLAGAKAGGILVETTTAGGQTIAIVGVGVNVARAPRIEGRAVTCLADHAARAVTVDGLLGALDRALTHWLGSWQAGRGFEAVRQAWLQRGAAAGERMAVNGSGSRVEGAFRGLDVDGALLLGLADGTVKRMTFGDVSLIGDPAKGQAT